MTIRVLEVIPTLVRGGAEKQLCLLAAGLPRDEFEPHVAVLTHGGPRERMLREAEVPYTVIGKKWKIDPLAYQRLRRLIRELRPDLVHTWIFAANAYGRQAALAERVPCVVAGERCVDRWKVWHELAIDRWLARRTTRIVTNSSGVREFYAARGVPADKFEIIPNGIAIPEVVASRNGSLRAELGLPGDSRLIGAVGRLWPQKRYKDLVWAAELLKAARDDTHLLIIGDGPQRNALERFAQDVLVHDRVHFLGERDDISSVLPQLDCFWLGSGYEGQSNALMEAMAVGVPAVATDIPGNRDLVIPEETGYLVPVGDAAEFARKTQLILDDADRASRFAAAARRRMETEFSVDAMVRRHAELYRRLVLD